MKNEQKYAGQSFSINLKVKIVIEVFDGTSISDILKTIYFMLDDEVTNDELFTFGSRKKFSAFINDYLTKIEEWQITNIENMYWKLPEN